MKNKSNPQSRSSLGFFGIIRESFKTTSRNRKLLFPILLLAFLSYSQLELAEDYLRPNVFEDFLLPLARNQNIYHFTRNIDSVTYSGAFNDIFDVLLYRHFTRPSTVFNHQTNFFGCNSFVLIWGLQWQSIRSQRLSLENKKKLEKGINH